MTHALLPAAKIEIVDSLRERCDRCDAAAKLAMDLAAGGDLAFCGHHANRYAIDILRASRRVFVLRDFPWLGTAAGNDGE